ncbi:hypothetical protein SCLCIDRAFT_765809 [Scleroderma citrinum Foug A]|uniref:Uncharacterized protein n=1 Tax=Scleroderma citrinum Foug A TaxID=1036808 RepID=A0A0C2ZCM0_9AGAM|nr:hypothetical protein SCLCIDRAFT_765809 [Scleroderma citrinum Foug A]
MMPALQTKWSVRRVGLGTCYPGCPTVGVSEARLEILRLLPPACSSCIMLGDSQLPPIRPGNFPVYQKEQRPRQSALSQVLVMFVYIHTLTPLRRQMSIESMLKRSTLTQVSIRSKTPWRWSLLLDYEREREFYIYIPLQANRCAKTRCQKAVGEYRII